MPHPPRHRNPMSRSEGRNGAGKDRRDLRGVTPRGPRTNGERDVPRSPMRGGGFTSPRAKGTLPDARVIPIVVRITSAGRRSDRSGSDRGGLLRPRGREEEGARGRPPRARPALTRTAGVAALPSASPKRQWAPDLYTARDGAPMPVKSVRLVPVRRLARERGHHPAARRRGRASSGRSPVRALLSVRSGVLLLAPDRLITDGESGGPAHARDLRGKVARARRKSWAHRPGRRQPVASAYRAARHRARDRDRRPGGARSRSCSGLSGSGVLLVVISLRDLTQARRLHQELRRHERLATLGRLSPVWPTRSASAGRDRDQRPGAAERFEPRDERARFVQVSSRGGALDKIVTSLLRTARPRVAGAEAGRDRAVHRSSPRLAADAIQHAGVKVEVAVSPPRRAVYLDADLITQVLLK